MKRVNIDILGCSEVRWPNSGHCKIDDYDVYHCGDTTTQNRNGVAMIVSKEVNNCVINFMGISNRVALLKINVKPFNINIIQSYAPTSESSDQEIEIFYEQLRTALKYTKKQEVNIPLGDFNAKVSRAKVLLAMLWEILAWE
ncbi:craniofacial development protein 2-like [Sitophilus oryzae]|uniref:Craniofacial development protein 2-like n=1 Tax=Sitophilus oryzae TaxID=7048 RepID=A0A6J2XJ85_SITOR|nr:craniofacial development protein 2-like [Sitophilus oryzae]